MVRRLDLSAIFVITLSLATAGCDELLRPPLPTSPSRALASIALLAPGLMEVGQNARMRVIGMFSDGTTSELDPELTRFWTGDANIASVAVRPNGTGNEAVDHLYANKEGTTIVFAQYTTFQVSQPLVVVGKLANERITAFVQGSFDHTYEGTLASDGTVNLTQVGSATLPSGAVVAGSTFSGRVSTSGNSVGAMSHGGAHLTATETLRFTNGCPGPVVFGYSLTSTGGPNLPVVFTGTATKTADNGCGFRDSFDARVTISPR